MNITHSKFGTSCTVLLFYGGSSFYAAHENRPNPMSQNYFYEGVWVSFAMAGQEKSLVVWRHDINKH